MILLDVPPFSALFGALYRLGLRRLLARLERLDCVHAVYGSGSFFEGRPVHGLSDVDLVIVVDERFSRLDLEPQEVIRTYGRVRRFFPFLGKWDEKAENVVFLSEVALGFPLPESLRLRAKLGRLRRLIGPEEAAWLPGGPVTACEASAEIATLLRLPLTKGPVHASNLRFWQKLFLKLLDLAELSGCDEEARELRARPELEFLGRGERRLFFTRSRPEGLYPLLLGSAAAILERMGSALPAVTLEPPREAATEESAPTPALERFRRSAAVSVRRHPSFLLAWTPRLNYFPAREGVPVVEVEGSAWRGLRAALEALHDEGRPGESWLVRAGGFLFIVTHQEGFTDVVALDPLAHAPAYAAADPARARRPVPVAVVEEQRAAAEGIFRAFATLYRRNAGHVQRLPFPCVYLEDDLVVLRDALHRMRVRLFLDEGRDHADRAELIGRLAALHPEAARLLGALREQAEALEGGSGLPRDGGNVFRVLHEFMAQLLAGVSPMVLGDPDARLGITVGIITRNRASDLEECLESLTRQARAPDEVLVVDNGSTDRTAAVLDSFRAQLPLTVEFLAQAGIPSARNKVLEHARHEVIAFTDDDCVLEPGWLQAVERGFLRADNIGMVGGWVCHEHAPSPSAIDTYYATFHHNTT
ncbi:MAG: glycosyltransferase family A protein [Thermoanaerobaculia bacterium]